MMCCLSSSERPICFARRKNSDISTTVCISILYGNAVYLANETVKCHQAFIDPNTVFGYITSAFSP